LFPKQNYNVLSPNFHIHVSVNDLYIFRMPILLQPNSQTHLGEYINRSQIHECRNWERGRAVSFLGKRNSDFRYSVVGWAACLVMNWVTTVMGLVESTLKLEPGPKKVRSPMRQLFRSHPSLSHRPSYLKG
jgi:hypothetical protein